MAEKIVYDKLGNIIEWDGPGMYIANLIVGPLAFRRIVPEDSINEGVVSLDFASKPLPYYKPEEGILWR